MKKGDLVLIPFPFTDLTGAKKRPAVVLIDSDMDITVSFISTQLKWIQKFDVTVDPTPENGLKKSSLIRLRKITTIDKDLVIGKLGSLSYLKIKEMDQGLIGLFDL